MSPCHPLRYGGRLAPRVAYQGLSLPLLGSAPTALQFSTVVAPFGQTPVCRQTSLAPPARSLLVQEPDVDVAVLSCRQRWIPSGSEVVCSSVLVEWRDGHPTGSRGNGIQSSEPPLTSDAAPGFHRAGILASPGTIARAAGDTGPRAVGSSAAGRKLQQAGWKPFDERPRPGLGREKSTCIETRQPRSSTRKRPC